MTQATFAFPPPTVALRRPKTGAELRDRGMSRAINHARLIADAWPRRALDWVRRYPGAEFMTEDVRQWAYEQGLPRPPHERAWGAVMIQARKAGWIRFERYEAVDNPRAHKTPATVWRRTK